jgi:hypothetical protein
MKELLELGLKIAAAIGTLWAAYSFLRHLIVRLRAEPLEAADLEKERAYLLAFEGYLEDLDSSLRYSDKEYTKLAAEYVGESLISLRFVFRQSSAEDQLGLTPADIISSKDFRHLNDIVPFLKGAKRPIILLGEPGSGKSVTLRHCALEVTRSENSQKHVWGAIPLYLQLGAYNQTDNEGKPIHIIDFIKYQLEQVIPGGQNIKDSLDQILRKGRALILLDAMDEMPSADFPARADELKRFLIEYGKLNRIVVVCRKREYSGSFAHCEIIIEPFDSHRVKEYLRRNWELYSRVKLTPEVRYSQKGNYLAVADPSHALYTFATNPFWLKLFTTYFFERGGVIPQGLSEVFDSYIKQKLRRERTRMNIPDLVADSTLGIWKAIAYGSLETNRGTYFGAESVSELPILVRSAVGSIRRALEIGISCGLILREKDNSLRFEHHRILEYLAASYWEDSDPVAIRRDQLTNPWWREVIALRSGITHEPDRVVKEICDNFVVADSPSSGQTDWKGLGLATLECPRRCKRAAVLPV